ncbi:MAG: hypothetical protein WC575_01400 [Patescibacteria group bacterium]
MGKNEQEQFIPESAKKEHDQVIEEALLASQVEDKASREPLGEAEKTTLLSEFLAKQEGEEVVSRPSAEITKKTTVPLSETPTKVAPVTEQKPPLVEAEKTEQAVIITQLESSLKQVESAIKDNGLTAIDLVNRLEEEASRARQEGVDLSKIIDFEKCLAEAKKDAPVAVILGHLNEADKYRGEAGHPQLLENWYKASREVLDKYRAKIDPEVAAECERELEVIKKELEQKPIIEASEPTESKLTEVTKEEEEKVKLGEAVWYNKDGNWPVTITEVGGRDEKGVLFVRCKGIVNGQEFDDYAPFNEITYKTEEIKPEIIISPEALRLLKELKAENLPELKLEWKKVKVKVQAEGGKQDEVEEYRAVLSDEAKNKVKELVASYQLPETIKTQLEQSLVGELESRFSQSIQTRTELEASHILRHDKKKALLIGGAGATAVGVLAGIRILTGAGNFISKTLGTGLRIAGFTSLGTVSGYLRGKAMTAITPTLAKLSRGETGLDTLAKVAQDTAQEVLKKETVQLVSSQIIRETLTKELSLPESRVKSQEALENLLAKQELFVDASPLERGDFARQLETIYRTSQTTEKRLAKFMEYVGSKKGRGWTQEKKGILIGGAYGLGTSGSVELARALDWGQTGLENAPLLASAVIGGKFYGEWYQQLLKRRGIEERYKIMEKRIAGAEVATADLESFSATQENVNEIYNYLNSGLLSFDPVLESRAKEFIQKAVAQDILPEIDLTKSRFGKLEKRLARERKLEYGVSRAGGVLTGWLVGKIGTEVGKWTLGALGIGPKGPTVEVKPEEIAVVPPKGQPIEVEIRGKINTFTEALDKAVHQAPAATQDNFIHKILGAPVEVTDTNRDEFLIKAVNKLSVDNLHGVGKMNVENLVYEGNKLNLNPDGSWDVIKGESSYGPKIVTEQFLRDGAAKIKGASIESPVHEAVGAEWQKAEFPQWPDQEIAWREALPSELPPDANLSDISMRVVDINGDGQADTYFLYDIDDSQVIDQVVLEPGETNAQLIEQAQTMYQQAGQEAKALDQIIGETGKNWDTGDRIIFSRGLGAEFKNGAFDQSSVSVLEQAVDKLGQQAPEFMRDHNLAEYIKGHLEQITCEQVEKMHEQGTTLYQAGWKEVDYNYVDEMVKHNRVTDGVKLQTKLLSPATNKNLAVEFIDKNKFDAETVTHTYELAKNAQTELADYVRILKSRFEIIPAAQDHNLVNKVLSLDTKTALASFKGSYGGEQQAMIDKLYQELDTTLGHKLSQGKLSGTIGENLEKLVVSKTNAQALIGKAELIEKQFQAQNLIGKAEQILNK